MTALAQSVYDSFLPEAVKWVGLVASIAGVVVGQAEIIPEPYRHYLTLIATLSTAVLGVLIRLTPPTTKE